MNNIYLVCGHSELMFNMAVADGWCVCVCVCRTNCSATSPTIGKHSSIFNWIFSIVSICFAYWSTFVGRFKCNYLFEKLQLWTQAKMRRALKIDATKTYVSMWDGIRCWFMQILVWKWIVSDNIFPELSCCERMLRLIKEYYKIGLQSSTSIRYAWHIKRIYTTNLRNTHWHLAR